MEVIIERPHILCVLVGPSGAGKTTVANKLFERFGLTTAESHTDRVPRYEGETGHVFVSPETMAAYDAANKLVAPTTFDGHRYGYVIDNLVSADIVIVDLPGAKAIRDVAEIFGKPVYIIGLTVSPGEAIDRMCARSDSTEALCRRLTHDVHEFRGMEYVCDVCIHNQNLDDTVQLVWQLLRAKENSLN